MNNSCEGPEIHLELNVVILLLINLFLRSQVKGTPRATFAQHASILFLWKHLVKWTCLRAKMWLLKLSLSVIFREIEELMLR